MPAFPASPLELKFAKIRFSTDIAPQTWTAEFHLVRGLFFSVTFTPSVKKIRRTKSVRVDKVDILVDLMSPAPERPTRSRPAQRDSIKLPRWIEELEKTYGVRGDLFEPLPRDLRAPLLKEITATLPEDYLQLLDATDGMALGAMSILGLRDVYDVVMPDGNYSVIGELESKGVLAVKAGNEPPELYLLDYSGAPPRNMARSLENALRALFRESQDGC